MDIESRRKYMRNYYQKHKEKINKINKKWQKSHREYYQKYYQEHKQQVFDLQKNWRKKNSKRFSELCQQSRKRRVERLRKQGCKNAWSVVSCGKDPKY